MDLSKIPLFAAARQRLAWLDRRQEVLAQNIANADTPGFKPRDLKPFAFEMEVQRSTRRLAMRTGDDAHMPGMDPAPARPADHPVRRPFETTPAGNGVVLEEQMSKVSETSLTHHLTTGLYRKHLEMIGLAVGKRT